MKKVLIVAFEFPPLGSGGVIRCAKYVKYLRSFGWEPVVLTIDERSQTGAPKDYSLLQQLPDNLEIHRTPYVDFDVLFQREIQSSVLLSVYASIDSNFRGLFGFAKPDKNITWFPNALEKAIRLVKKGDIDLIYTDSPPNSTALVGYKLKEIFGIPWIADFRDPWSLDDLAYENLEDQFHKKAREVDRLLEKIILEKCDRLIVVSEKLKQNYMKHLGLQNHQIAVIRNGYDEEDFNDLPPAKKGDENLFEIKYMGSFYGSYNPSVFLKALDKLITAHGIEDIRFHIIGHGSKWVHQNLRRLKLNKLNPYIEIQGHIDLKQCLSRMLDSDLLLVVSPSDIDYNVPQKIFTYMRLGVPIFAVMPETGEAASIINASGCGYVIDPQNIDRVEEKLHALYLLWKKGALVLEQDPDFIRRFDKKGLTGKVTALFDDVRHKHLNIIAEINKRGENLYEKAELESALQTFQEALDLYPLSTETLNNLGVVSFQMRNYEKALEYFIKALEINPTDKDSLINTYQIYHALNLQNDAEEIWRKLLDVFGEEELLMALKVG